MCDGVSTGWEVTGADLGTLVAEVAEVAEVVEVVEVAAMADAVISAASCGGACRRHGRPLRRPYHCMPTSPYRCMPVSLYPRIGPESDGHTLPTITTTTTY